MNRRLLVLLLVLAVLGGIAWWLQQRTAPTTLDVPLTDFAVPDTARVTRLFITDTKGHVSDLRREGDRWTLNGRYDARQPLVDMALKTLLRVEVRSPVPKSTEPMVLRTMAGTSTKVEIYEGSNKPSKVWIIGHATKDHYGTYMVLEKPGEGRSSAPFVMGMGGFTGVLSPRFPATEDNWRSPNVFHYPDLHELASVKVDLVGRPLASYRIDNPDVGLPKLLAPDGRQLPMDTVLVQGALLPYKEFNYEYIDRKTPRDSLLAAPPNVVLTVTPRTGDAETMKLWYMPYHGEAGGFGQPRPIHDPMRMFALVQDTLIVVVQRQYTDRMTQPATALMP